MRIHVPAPCPRESGDFWVRVNGNGEPFATIALDEQSATEICLDSPGDARRLVRAAAMALYMLERSIKGGPHQHRPGPPRTYCADCGQGRSAAIHQPPYPEPAGQGGVLSGPVDDGWCPAFTVMEDGETLYCDRETGHPGSHHAPGPGEGSEVAWSDGHAGGRSRHAAPAPQACGFRYLDADGIARSCQRQPGGESHKTHWQYDDCNVVHESGFPAIPAAGDGDAREPRPPHHADGGGTRTAAPGRIGVPEHMPIPAAHYCDSGNCGACGDGTGDGAPAAGPDAPAFVTEISGVPVSSAFGLVAS